MTAQSREEQKREAFRLFEEGRYAESLQICTALIREEGDPALDVLAATNLYSLERYDEAEASFRDLLHRMPDSSYVHSYLAKILEHRGDESAIAEYATAVHLDPTNQDALRSYAEYLIGRRDYHAALPVLRRLVSLSETPEDVRNLMRAFIGIGNAGEALTLHAGNAGAGGRPGEYVDALVLSRRYPEAAATALAAWHETQDPVILRKYLSSLARYDLPASLAAYATHTGSIKDQDILLDYVLLLKSTGDYPGALAAARTLADKNPDPLFRLLQTDLLAAAGDGREAIEAYEQLIRDELGAENDPDTLGLIIGRYRLFLFARLPLPDATARFLALISRDVNVACLLETARMYEEQGNETEARAWYYRAYRADFLTGGLAYALFLSSHGDDRECEKVMLYILSNARKGDDLIRVAAVVLDELGGMFRLRRLMDQLVRRLEERRHALSSRGLELLAMAFFISASNALEETDYQSCKYFCLCGLDVMPAHTAVIRQEDFLRLMHTCKERAVADRPILGTARDLQHPPASAAPADDMPGLDEQEQKIVQFLRLHRQATERELRTLLSTRRVAGIVNRLIQKAAKSGVVLIAKKGVGENGEIYEYAGT